MTRAYALAQALSHVGHTVEILGVKLSPGPLYPKPPANIKVTEVSGYGRLHSLLRLVTKLDGDTIYAIKPRLSSYGVALLKRWLSRSPVILDIDDWEMAEINAVGELEVVPRTRRPLMAADIVEPVAGLLRGLLRQCSGWLNPADPVYIRWLDKLICRADAITVNSRYLQSLYGGTYVPQCKDVVKFDPDKYSPEHSRKRLGLSAYIVFMFPGTARPHKGLEDILAAMDEYRNPDVRLVIVGGRSGADDYVAQLMRRWARWIIRMPAFPQEEMPGIVAAAHAVVVPQRDTAVARAQFPIKLTDGMAMAKPIIATRVGDIPEILGDCGYLVEPSNPGQLVKVLDQIVRDLPMALERGGLAREKFISCYSLGAVGSVLSGVVESVG